jgi:lysophospholipase L1-like esterase
MKGNRIIIILLSLSLLVSLAVNIIFFRSGQSYYRQLTGIRLDPLGLSHYPTDASQQPSPLPNQRRVVFFGDSRAAVWTAPTGLDQFQFVNRGIANQTSAEVLHRFDEHVVPLDPDIVVVQVGINDLKAIPIFPEQKPAIVANCQANIVQIVAKCRDLGAAVILTTVFPLGKVPLERRLFWSGDVAEAIEEVNTFLSSMEGERVIVLSSADVLADERGVTHKEYSTDMLHLNAQGYQALNAALVKILAGSMP